MNLPFDVALNIYRGRLVDFIIEREGPALARHFMQLPVQDILGEPALVKLCIRFFEERRITARHRNSQMHVRGFAQAKSPRTLDLALVEGNLVIAPPGIRLNAIMKETMSRVEAFLATYTGPSTDYPQGVTFQ